MPKARLDLEFIGELLKAGLNVNHANDQGMDALLLAVTPEFAND